MTEPPADFSGDESDEDHTLDSGASPQQFDLKSMYNNTFGEMNAGDAEKPWRLEVSGACHGSQMLYT